MASKISSFINTAKQIATKSGCAVNTKIDNIVIRVSCLGEYSSGKSALLNALLGEKFFAESITKETATATNIFHTIEKSYYVTRNKQGIESEPLKFTSSFSTTTFGSNITEIDVYLNVDKMGEFARKDIFFTDLPGTNSGEESHEMIINETLINSNVILICVPANQGTISAGLLQKVESVHYQNKNVQFIGITTKSDMPDITDGGKSHCELLKTELLKIIPKQNLLACVNTDAKTKKIDALIQKLHSIDDKYFIEYFFKKNAEAYKTELTTQLNSVIAMLNKNRIETIEKVKRQIAAERVVEIAAIRAKYIADLKRGYGTTYVLPSEEYVLDETLNNDERYLDLVAAISKLEKQKLAIQPAYELLIY
jgi:GTPase SAR1 family protein